MNITHREETSNTLVITKEGYDFLRDYTRKLKGFAPLTDKQRQYFWRRNDCFLNRGASQKQYPIASNEIRISNDSFCISVNTAEKVLRENGFACRNDGFIEESLAICF